MDEIKTLALACISRLGSLSPANEFASNTYLLRDLCEILIEKPIPTHIFACGGYDGFRYLKSVEIFDIVKNVWSKGEDMTLPRSDHGIAHIGDHVYVIGGCTRDDYMGGNYICKVFAYSISKNKWEELPSMFTERSSMGIGVVGRKIYVIGGFDRDFFDTCEVFDVDVGIWQRDFVAPMPTARCDAGVAVVGDLIYVIGGWNLESIAAVEVLDTKKNTWKTLPPMPTARFSMGIAVIDDRFIWTFGGFSNSRCVYTIEVFDIMNNAWSTSPIELTSRRSGLNAIAVDHKIYIIGGCGGFDAMNLVEILDTDTMKWSIASHMIERRTDSAASGF